MTRLSFENLDVNNLIISDENVRKNLTSDYDETDIDDLANSIKLYGLIHPISVKLHTDNKYAVIAGQRRLLAAKKIKMENDTMSNIKCKQ